MVSLGDSQSITYHFYLHAMHISPEEINNDDTHPSGHYNASPHSSTPTEQLNYG